MIREYKRGTQITPNFKADEFICKCTNCKTKGIAYLEEKFIHKLQLFREKLGKQIIITPNGGNRCEVWNKQRGGAENSRHLSIVGGKPKHCDGADFSVPGIAPDDLAVMAEEFGFNGVGVYAPGNIYIHADARPGDHVCWWLKTSGSNTPGFGGIPVLFKQGNRSPAIIKIQQELNKIGVLSIKPDGKGTMDTPTVTALKKYQSMNNLKPDGVFGYETNKIMKIFNWWRD